MLPYTPNLVSCRASNDYTLWLLYSDGVTGIVDLENFVTVDTFRRLRDRRIFRAARIDAQTGTVAWRAGVRLDSEVLYTHIKASWRRPPAS